MLKFLPGHVRKACRKDATPITPPFSEADERGVAAVIDISGFTKLTTRLTNEHGTDGAARLRDVINDPLDKIVRAVYARSGSIVKFAGDAALVCWSEPDAKPSRRTELLAQSLTCCFELLRAFEDRRRQSVIAGDAGADAGDGIGVHIGLGFGWINHIHLGELGSAPDRNRVPRREYLIAGEAVCDAAATLNRGSRGQLVMSPKFCAAIDELLASISPKPRSFLSISKNAASPDGEVIMSADSPMTGELLQRLDNCLSRNFAEEYQNDETLVDEVMDEALAVQYIESSVVRYLQETKETHPVDWTTHGRPSMVPTLEIPDESEDFYSDLRNVAVVFFRFTAIRLDLANQSSSSKALQGQPTSEKDRGTTVKSFPSDHPVSAAQFVAKTAISCIRNHGGSLRQVSFDDKAFTALAVWGLRGSAHQRAESQYALHACLEFARRVGPFASFPTPADSIGPAVGNIAIGVTSGTVYAGLVGNELRMDGTVLGPAVNLAARIMCLETPSGREEEGQTPQQMVRIWCDRPTFEANRNQFEFGMEPVEFHPKGFEGLVSIYPVLRELEASRFGPSDTSTVVGRAKECALLEATIVAWKNSVPNQSVLITGRSGFGKSALLSHFSSRIEKEPQTILVSCVADEMKQKSSFAFFGSLFIALAAQLQASGVDFTHIASAGRKSTSSSTSPTTDGIDRADICWTRSNPIDPALRFLMEVLMQAEISRGAWCALAAVPGLRGLIRKDLYMPNGDLGAMLSAVLKQVLDRVAELQHGIVIVCDDAQWIDHESVSTLQKLMILSPQVLFAYVGRIREEWELVEDFDCLRSRCNHEVELGPLDGDAVRALIKRDLGENVDDSSIEEIINQSNGIPIAIRVILSAMAAELQSNSPVENKLLPFQSEKRSSRLPSAYYSSSAFKSRTPSPVRSGTKVVNLLEINGGSTLSAQLDSLNPEFRLIVSVAAVIGQHFDLRLLWEVLQNLDKHGSAAEASFSSLKRILTRGDRFGFIATNKGEKNRFEFSHHLIYRAVLAALLPQRREAIRRVLIARLIERYKNEGDDGLLLSTIIEHLTQIAGEEDLKCEYLYKGFIEAAEARKLGEALYCREMIDQINSKYYEKFPLTERLRDILLLLTVHHQLGNVHKTVHLAEILLKLCGASFPSSRKNMLSFLASFRRHFKILRGILKAPPQRVRKMCGDYLARTLPLAFPTPERRRKRSGTIHPMEECDGLQSATTGEGADRLETVVRTLEILFEVSFEAKIPGIDFFVYQMAVLFLSLVGEMSTGSKSQWKWRLKLGFLRLGFLFIAAGFKTRGESCAEESEKYPNTTFSLWDFECKANYCLMSSMMCLVRNERLTLAHGLLVREALDSYKAAGVEFEVFPKNIWLGLALNLQTQGIYSPCTPQDDRQFVLQLKSCVALEYAMRNDLIRSRTLIEACSDLALNQTASELQVGLLPLFFGVSNVFNTLVIFVQHGEDFGRWLQLFDVFGNEVVLCLNRLEVHLIPAAAINMAMIEIHLVGLGLSTYELDTLSPSDRAKIGKLGSRISKSLEKMARSAKLQILTDCAINLTHASRLLFSGKLLKFERKLRRLHARLKNDLPVHMALQLEAHLLRCRCLREGRESVSGEARALLQKFEEFDNRWDPSRIAMFCV
ncbi:AAA ATPase domain-containing protein [Zopfochytrium polystomum]|nr:AAA ATPase domain-containing protein [Zopfochytrium polystomum]